MRCQVEGEYFCEDCEFFDLVLAAALLKVALLDDLEAVGCIVDDGEVDELPNIALVNCHVEIATQNTFHFFILEDEPQDLVIVHFHCAFHRSDSEEFVGCRSVGLILDQSLETVGAICKETPMQGCCMVPIGLIDVCSILHEQVHALSAPSYAREA